MIKRVLLCWESVHLRGPLEPQSRNKHNHAPQPNGLCCWWLDFEKREHLLCCIKRENNWLDLRRIIFVFLLTEQFVIWNSQRCAGGTYIPVACITLIVRWRVFVNFHFFFIILIGGRSFFFSSFSTISWSCEICQRKSFDVCLSEVWDMEECTSVLLLLLLFCLV